MIYKTQCDRRKKCNGIIKVVHDENEHRTQYGDVICPSCGLWWDYCLQFWSIECQKHEGEIDYGISEEMDKEVDNLKPYFELELTGEHFIP